MYIKKIEIHVSQAGTLENLISEDEKISVTHLKLTGILNSKDFELLEDMCSGKVEIDENDNHTIDLNAPPFLIDLDLGETIMLDFTNLYDFTYYSKLERFVCPMNIESTSNMSVFEDSIFLKRVILPDSLKVIGFGTFMNCKKLEAINFPKKLKMIGDFAFCNCISLKTLQIPLNVSAIGCGVFGGCNNLEKFEVDELSPYLTVIDGVLYSKDETKIIAFPCGIKNKHYTIPEGVKTIGEGAFLGAKINSITFPSSLRTIERFAFRFCNNLQSLDIPDSVKEIGESAFEFCKSLSRVKLSNVLKVLKHQTFGGTDNLKEIDIPNSVRIIENTALGWSNSLETIHLHEGLESLYDLTECKTLKNITIPKTVKEISSGIFRKSLNITHIKIDEENPHFCVLNGILFNKDKTKIIAVPQNENKLFVIPEGVQIIEDFVFEGFEKLEQIDFPDSLQIIGHRAFEGCIALKKLSFSKALISIDFRAFDKCENLEVIKIEAENPPKITNAPASCWKFIGDSKRISLQVPKNSLKRYKKAFGWRDLNNYEV